MLSGIILSSPYKEDTESQRRQDISSRPQLEAATLGAYLRIPVATENFLGLTEYELVPWQLPGGIIRQLYRVHVDVFVAIRAHRLNHLPSDLIAWFLQDKTNR